MPGHLRKMAIFGVIPRLYGEPGPALRPPRMGLVQGGSCGAAAGGAPSEFRRWWDRRDHVCRGRHALHARLAQRALYDRRCVDHRARQRRSARKQSGLSGALRARDEFRRLSGIAFLGQQRLDPSRHAPIDSPGYRPSANALVCRGRPDRARRRQCNVGFQVGTQRTRTTDNGREAVIKLPKLGSPNRCLSLRFRPQTKRAGIRLLDSSRKPVEPFGLCERWRVRDRSKCPNRDESKQ